MVLERVRGDDGDDEDDDRWNVLLEMESDTAVKCQTDRESGRERRSKKSDMTCPLLSKSDVEPEQRAHTHPAHQKALKWSKAEKKFNI